MAEKMALLKMIRRLGIFEILPHGSTFEQINFAFYCRYLPMNLSSCYNCTRRSAFTSMMYNHADGPFF